MEQSEYEDVELICTCGAPFIWTAGEQTFLQSLFNAGKIREVVEPKRCVPCRKKKKEQRERENQNYE